MDKLELDARVARLERRVSVLTALLSALVLAGAVTVSAITLNAARMSRVEERTAATVMTPTAATIRVVSATNGMDDLALELRKLRDMQLQGLITGGDLGAKKALILAMPVRAGDYAVAMRAAKSLQDEGLLTGQEYDALKKKILEIGD